MTALNPPIAEPFSFKDASRRQGKFMADYLKAAFGVGDSFIDPEQTAKQMQQFLMDASMTLSEVKRLYSVFDALKRKHMPHPGEPGAPVKCTSCSMHGGEVPWPCETYKAADAVLPEGWPL